MKIQLLIALLQIWQIGICYAQDQDFEKKNYYEMQARTKFYEVNDRYEIQEDTIFFATSGFLINVDWDEAIIGGKNYVIFTYPDYKKGKQSATEPAVKLKADDKVINYSIVKFNGKTLAMLKEDFDNVGKVPIFSVKFSNMRNYRVTSGQLTLPFKLRPKIGANNFQMTTDVTIGAYGGLRKRLSKRSPAYLTLPAVLGLSFININENTTTTAISTDMQSGITPGWTWSTGLIIQYNNFNAGIVIGRDYASGYAEEWIYHGKTWSSFAIGYSFVK